jgi:Na+/glutamate symporter
MEISMLSLAIAFYFNFFYPFIYMCIFVFLSMPRFFQNDWDWID